MDVVHMHLAAVITCICILQYATSKLNLHMSMGRNWNVNLIAWIM